LYKEEENGEGACRYHRGKFQASATFTAFGSLKRWSCCLKEEESGEGCTFGWHKEDSRVTGILKTFDAVEDNSEEDKPEPATLKKDTNFDASPNKQNQGDKIEKRESRKTEVQHEVSKDDTLLGLAVKYNVSVAAIKRANKLFGDQIFGRKVLKIPPEEAK